jgi:Ca-activated chloride channel family protein
MMSRTTRLPLSLPACALLLALAGCGSSGSSGQNKADAASDGVGTAAFSPAEKQLLAGGAKETDVVAARAFVAPFTRTDPASCFGSATLEGAKLDAGGAAPDGPALARVAIAIDGSGSMAGRIGSTTKLARAHEATQAFIDNLPEGVPASLAVFGQQGDNSESGKAKSCRSVDMLAPMSTDRAQLKAAVAGVKAVGWTPLAAGLQAAQAQLGPSSIPGEQIIYIVSDGVETCGGDPVTVARAINRGRTRAIINIIGFGLPTGEAAALQSVASAGGGRFVNVTDDDGFAKAMAGYREAMRLARNRVSARLTAARNTIATGSTATGAVQCTGDLIARETRQTLAGYDAGSAKGAALPPRYQVVALLKERHDAIAARRDAHVARLGATRESANQAVEDARKAAQ